MKNGIFNQKRKTARKKVNPLSLNFSSLCKIIPPDLQYNSTDWFQYEKEEKEKA